MTVPWCEECAKYLAPTSMKPDGTCPKCGGPVGESEQRASEVADDESTPWHFKLLVLTLIAYLGWRLVQLLT